MDKETEAAIQLLTEKLNNSNSRDRSSIQAAISKLKSKNDNTTSSFGTNSNDTPKSGGLTDLEEMLLNGLEGSLYQAEAPSDSGAFDTLLKSYSQNRNKGGGENIVSSMFSAIGETAVKTMQSYVKEQSYLLSQVNQQLGLSGELSNDFREQLTEAQPALVRMGIPFKELTKSAGQLVETTGRFALVGTDMLVRAGEVATAYGMDMSEIVQSYAEFEKVGIGAAEAQESIADAGKKSLELGLQSRTTIKGMMENIGKLNEYGFENGSEGLAKMVRRATEMRYSLESVFKVADKVFDPESALDLSANLQVLGAAFGDFNDPLRLMYMATNEVEGLSGALEGVSQNLATYNTETGGFEVTGANLRQARDIAKALGVDLKDVTQSAIAGQERLSAMLSLEGSNISDEDKEFITNISRMKDGKMQVELMTPELQKAFGGASVELDKLSQEGVNQLLKYREQFKEMDEGELVRKQVTLTENISRDVNFMVTIAKLRTAGAADSLIKAVSGLDAKAQGQNLSELLKEGTDSLVKKFGMETAAIVEKARSVTGLDKVMAEEEKKKQAMYIQKQNEGTTKTSKMDVTIKSDQLVSGMQKVMTLNPENWVEGLRKGDYLNIK
mgnify:CR=1 FL=1